MALTTATKKAAAKARAESEDAFPSREDASLAFGPALEPGAERVRGLLLALRDKPPQLLHLEGGLADQRFSLALWWHALLNCRNPGADGTPCLACPSCLQSGARISADLIVLDGREASIKIAEVRALRSLLGEPPRHVRLRLVLLAEAHGLTLEAANSLLKVLEDPCPGTVFLFTVPQRERLLPTLVSRGFVLTLPWPDPGRPLPAVLAEWEAALAGFLRHGRGWFDKSAVKGALDASLAQEIVLLVQKALARGLAGDAAGQGLASILAGLDGEALLRLDDVLANCQEALQDQVSPALVLDAMATRMHLLAGAEIRKGLQEAAASPPG